MTKAFLCSKMMYTGLAEGFCSSCIHDAKKCSGKLIEYDATLSDAEVNNEIMTWKKKGDAKYTDHVRDLIREAYLYHQLWTAFVVHGK